MYITVNKSRIELTLQPQNDKNGRPFVSCGTSLILTEPAVWYEGIMQHGTIYQFKYLDGAKEYFSFEFSAKGVYVKKTKE